MLPLRVWQARDYGPVWLRSSAPAPSLLGPGPASLLAQLAGDMQSHLEETERLRHSLLLAYPLLCGEGAGGRQRQRSGQSPAEGAERQPGAQEAGAGPYELSMDVSGFSPAELTVRLDGRRLTVTGKREQQTESEAGAWSRESRELRRETLLPEDVDAQAVLCSLSPGGQLRVEAPRVALPAAGGRAIPIRVCQGPAAAGEGPVGPEGQEPGRCEMEPGDESEGPVSRDS